MSDSEIVDTILDRIADALAAEGQDGMMVVDVMDVRVMYFYILTLEEFVRQTVKQITEGEGGRD